MKRYERPEMTESTEKIENVALYSGEDDRDRYEKPDFPNAGRPDDFRPGKKPHHGNH